MKRVVGYIISIVGLIIMALGLNVFKDSVGFLGGVDSWYLSIGGIILIIVGVVISLLDKGKGKSNQSKEEVPIYEGKGKNRKIVGYQRG